MVTKAKERRRSMEEKRWSEEQNFVSTAALVQILRGPPSDDTFHLDFILSVCIDCEATNIASNGSTSTRTRK